jgi:hypothetical protein
MLDFDSLFILIFCFQQDDHPTLLFDVVAHVEIELFFFEIIERDIHALLFDVTGTKTNKKEHRMNI